MTVEKGEEEGNYIWLARLVDCMHMCTSPIFVGGYFSRCVAINYLNSSFSDHFG